MCASLLGYGSLFYQGLLLPKMTDDTEIGKRGTKKIEKGRYPAPWFYKWIFILQFFLMGNSIHCTDGRTNDRNTYLFARPGLCKFLGCFQIYYCHFRLCSSHFLLCDRRSFLESISMHFCYAFEQAFNKVIY